MNTITIVEAFKHIGIQAEYLNEKSILLNGTDVSFPSDGPFFRVLLLHPIIS